LESGRRLGLIASLIAVVIPIVTVILYVFAFLSLIGGALSVARGGSSTFGSFFSTGFVIAGLAVGVIALAGIVLFLVGMHRLSQYYNESGIFKNALNGFLINIIGGASVIAISFAILFAAIFSAGTHVSTSPSFIAFPAIVIGLVVMIFVVEIVSAVFYKHAFDKLSDKSGVSSFGTAGTLYLVGTALTIILVGSIIMWVAWIEAASGFNSLKPKTEAPPPVSYYPPQPSSTINPAEKMYCVYCGAEISVDSDYCPNCGKKVQK
jgi:uncharacterized membrane protein